MTSNAYMFQKHTIPSGVEMSDYQKATVRKLIANLIGDRDRILEQGRWKLDPDFLPDDMGFERRVLSLIYYMRDEGFKPTPENLKRKLQLDYGDEAHHFLNDLIGCKTFDGDVATLAFSIGDWMYSQQQVRVGNQILRIFEDPKIPSNDKYVMAANLMQKIAPQSGNFTEINHAEAFAKLREVQQKNLEAHRAGRSLGPRFPFTSTWGKIKYFRPGEMTLLYAYTGWGKTNLCVATAEYIAQELGYDVLFAHFETDALLMEARIAARELWLPVEVVETGVYQDYNLKGEVIKEIEVDFSQGEWADKFGEKLDIIRKLNRENGELVFWHCAGGSVRDLELEVQKRNAIANQRGRGLVIICDYWQKFNWLSYGISSKPQGLNQVSLDCKNLVENANKENPSGVYMLMAAQDGHDASADADNVSTRDAKGIAQDAQLAVRLLRTKAKEDKKLWKVAPQKDERGIEQPGIQFKDAIGCPVYWHRDQEWSSDSTLALVKGNNVGTGTMPLRILNKYFKIGSA